MNERDWTTLVNGDEEIQLPVPKVLEWLGVDLDAMDEGTAAYRLRGVRIGVTLNYYNFDQAPGLEKKFTFTPGKEVLCIMELELFEEMAERFSERRGRPHRISRVCILAQSSIEGGFYARRTRRCTNDGRTLVGGR